jgi:hypothetical protein
MEDQSVNWTGRNDGFQPASCVATWRPINHGGISLTVLRHFASDRNAARCAPLSAAPGFRWSAWATRIAARCALGHHTWGWLYRIFNSSAKVRRTSVPPSNWTVALTIQPAPTVTNQIFAVALPSTSKSPAHADPIQPPPGSAVSRIRPHLVRTVERTRPPTTDRIVVTQHHQRTLHTVCHESTIITRLTARRERREPAATTHAVNSVRVPATPPIAVGPVVAHRPPMAPPEPPTPLRSTIPSRHEIGDGVRTPSQAVDLQSLTDQVIQTIDQRVIAARERLGAQ